MQTGATCFHRSCVGIVVLFVSLLGFAHPAMAWQTTGTADPTPPPAPSAPSQTDSASPSNDEVASDAKPVAPQESPRALVEEGNRRFKAGEYNAALESYDGAKSQKPDSLEVDFDRGLSAFSLGQLDDARRAFERVTLSPDTDLAENAMYGLGACDHAEALAQAEKNPKDAVKKLEQAMRRYHDVLSANPDHRLARDANYRAGLKWRQIKEMMKQQQQQQKGNEDKDQDKQQDQQDKQQQQGKQDPQQKKDQQERDKQKSDEQKQDQQQSADQQKQDQSASDQKKDEQEKKAEEQSAKQADAKKDLSRDQAARELRRLMDQMRERKQARREPMREVPAPPLGKDW